MIETSDYDARFDPNNRMQFSVIITGLSPSTNAFFQEGLCYHKSDDLDQAETCYRKALVVDPRHAGAIHYLGVIALVRKNFADALNYFESAISLCDDKAFFYNHYGIALNGVNRSEDAEKAFVMATQLDPQYADAWSNLGKLYLDHAKHDKAAKAIHKAIQITPHHPDAIIHLVDLFQQTDRHDEAIQLCLHYAKSSTSNPAFLKKIGGTLILTRCYREALALHQNLEAAHPGDAETLMNLGRIHAEEGNFNTSKGFYYQAAKIKKVPPLTPWYYLKYCPPVFRDEAAIDEYWKNLDRELGVLLEEQLKIDWRTTALDCVLPSFHLAHHGRSCREIRERFASIYRHVFPHERPMYRPKSRIRVGFVTSPGNEGGLLRGKAGIIRNLDPKRFETVVFCTNSSLAKCRNSIANDATEFVVLPDHFEQSSQVMRETQCDILYYWKVEPGTWNPFFSMTRPAPVQCTGWGTFGTSGFNSIDYYLTTSFLEPENVDFRKNYVEQTEIFSTFPMYCLKDEPLPQMTRKDFGLPEQGTLYFCPHRISKYHPSFDGILKEILSQDGQSHLILATESKKSTPYAILRERMQKNLGKTLLRQVIFLENLPYLKYRSLLSVMTMVLDSPVFSGGYTAYDAFSLGIPMITLTGPVNVQNFTAGFYHKLGMREYINRSREDYIKMAIRLSKNKEEREYLCQTMLERSDTLFNEAQAVRDFENFFEKSIQILTGD